MGGRGAEEVEGAAFCYKADHGQGPVCQTLDVEQVHLQLQPRGKIGRQRQDQAKERVPGIIQRRLSVKTETPSSQLSDPHLLICCLSHMIPSLYSLPYNQNQKKSQDFSPFPTTIGES